jgi:uncharacterized protein (DUF427 family)
MRYTIKERAGGTLIASGTHESIHELEGSWYFPPEAVNTSLLRITKRTYNCPYKGVCYWVDLESPRGRAQNIAWVYMHPKPGYDMIRGMFGFYDHDTAGTTAQME